MEVRLVWASSYVAGRLDVAPAEEVAGVHIPPGTRDLKGAPSPSAGRASPDEAAPELAPVLAAWAAWAAGRAIGVELTARSKFSMSVTVPSSRLTDGAAAQVVLSHGSRSSASSGGTSK